MQTDEAARAKLQRAIGTIKTWAKTITSDATVTETQDVNSWRLVIEPNARGACPVELMLRADGLYDIRIAGEGYEDQPLNSLDKFVPLLEAVSKAHVSQRVWQSEATGMPIALETVVTPSWSDDWRVVRALSPAANIDGDYKETAQFKDRAFLPYKRV